MNVLVTGGSGYIGYSLVHALDKMESVKSITIYDNLYRNNLNIFFHGDPLNKVSFINEDILNEYELEKACLKQDVIIHLAAHVDFPYSYKDNYRYEQINQFGSAVLYNVLKKTNPSKIIYASSGSVYGFDNEADENHDPMPENSYGKSKLEGEKYMRLLSESSQVSILRIGNVFGYNPVFRYDSVVNHFIFDALVYGKIQILGSGNQRRPFVHIDYVVKVCESIINDNQYSPVINVTQGSLDMIELRDILLKLHPVLEYIYVNANQDFKGYQMKSNLYQIEEGLKESVERSYLSFQNSFTIRPTMIYP